jgi:hypothetical protein
LPGQDKIIQPGNPTNGSIEYHATIGWITYSMLPLVELPIPCDHWLDYLAELSDVGIQCIQYSLSGLAMIRMVAYNTMLPLVEFPG